MSMTCNGIAAAVLGVLIGRLLAIYLFLGLFMLAEWRLNRINRKNTNEAT